MQFARPDNLWALLVLLPMLGVYLFWWHWKGRVVERVGDRDLLMAMASARSARRQVARAVFVLLGTALLCIAFAQPQWGQTNQPIKRTGVDVVFALDLSSSMSARDVAPNRLEAAKNEIETALDVLRGDRVGLVVFTAVSFVQSPLTTDYGAIRFYLDRLEPGQMPLGGTSLGRAVVDAVELLTGERVAESNDEDVEMRRAKNQVIVLITDGEDHESDPMGAAQLAHSEDIKIVTVGFGSEEGERIPIFRSDGSLAGYKRDRDGNIVRTRLDDETLQKMGETTGGQYIHYAGENSVANALVEYINALEKTEIETMLKERYRERYAFFALPGLLLLILALLMGERKPGGRRNRAGLVALLLIVTLFGAGCERAFEDTLTAVDVGNEFIEEENYEKALQAYRLAEKQIPARPELHYDIGRALLGLERWEEAADAFARALETRDPSLRFDALVNLGHAHAGREAWQEAWETFRDALVLAARNPGAIEEARAAEARWNLEVAWRKFFPPCAELDDEHEENDDPTTATKLEQPTVEKATLCGLDDDYYVVQAIPGTRVSVNATFRDLRDDPHEPREFLPRAADLRIALFDQTGDDVLVVDQGEPGELPEGRKATRTIDRFLVEEGMVSPETPHVLVKVEAAQGLEYEYDLTIESIPPCHAMEEDLEDNDSPEQAKVAQPGSHTMHHCAGDEDWFALDAEVGDSIFFDVQRPPDPERERPAELALELYDADGQIVATGEAEGPYLTLGARDVPEPGRFLLRVYGVTDDEQGPYTLDVYRYAPCIVGDDRFEENDSANAASPLDPNQPVQRYLRACDGDPDFYRIDFAEDQKERNVEVGLARVSTPAPGTDPTDQPAFEFDMVSPSGDQIIVPGREPMLDPEAEEQTNVPIELLVRAEDVEDESAILRVAGEHEFYHLVQLNVQDQQQQEQEQDQQQQPDEGQEEQNQQQQEQQDSDSGQSDQSESEGADGEDEQQPEEAEEQGQQEEPEESQPQPQPGDEETQQPTDDESARQRPADEAEAGRLEDILEALERTDDNFQMRKALENMPGRYIEKDW